MEVLRTLLTNIIGKNAMLQTVRYMSLSKIYMSSFNYDSWNTSVLHTQKSIYSTFLSSNTHSFISICLTCCVSDLGQGRTEWYFCKVLHTFSIEFHFMSMLATLLMWEFNFSGAHTTAFMWSIFKVHSEGILFNGIKEYTQWITQ